MGTIGLSFGSPTSGQGIDVASTVSQMVAQLQATEKPYKIQLSAMQAQDTVISNLGSLLSTLSTDISALTDGAASCPANRAPARTRTHSRCSPPHDRNRRQPYRHRAAACPDLNRASNAVAASDTLSGSFTCHIGNGSSQMFP